MRKKIASRMFIGALLGFAGIWAVTVMISLLIGDGRFYPVVPSLAAEVGGEMKAVLLQCCCALLLGAAWGGAYCITENKTGSLLRQTVLHWIVGSAVTFPIAYVLHWMERSLSGFFLYFLGFCAIYAAIWLFQYLSIRRNLRQVNAKLKETQF